MKKDKEKDAKKKRVRVEASPADADALLARALEAVGGKWKLRVLLALSGGKPLRYGQLRARVAGITDMMLSQSLRELCAAGLVERTQYAEIPPRVDYALTGAAAGAVEAAALLCRWGGSLSH